MLSSTTRKICWFTIHALFNSSSTEDDQRTLEPEDLKITKASLPKEVPITPTQIEPAAEPRVRPRRGFFTLPNLWPQKSSAESWNNNVSVSEPDRSSVRMGAIKCCDSNSSEEKKSSNIPDKSPAGFFTNGQLEKSRNGCCKCEMPAGQDTDSLDPLNKKVLSFQDAPFYLRFNPYITGGYRSSLSPRECIKR